MDNFDLVTARTVAEAFGVQDGSGKWKQAFTLTGFLTALEVMKATADWPEGKDVPIFAEIAALYLPSICRALQYRSQLSPNDVSLLPFDMLLGRIIRSPALTTFARGHPLAQNFLDAAMGAALRELPEVEAGAMKGKVASTLQPNGLVSTISFPSPSTSSPPPLRFSPSLTWPPPSKPNATPAPPSSTAPSLNLLRGRSKVSWGRWMNFTSPVR
ncbi:hypothetical protein BDY24DRAFT_443377 [Mrakia frigida]|uniref:uncharacterized protein n=1 Tax=Mrakia frigida TaxID=29902 RepID=UPI003FCC10AE